MEVSISFSFENNFLIILVFIEFFFVLKLVFPHEYFWLFLIFILSSF